MKENTVYFFKLSASNFKTGTIAKSLLHIGLWTTFVLFWGQIY